MDLNELLEAAVMDGVIDLECPKCGNYYSTEPDNVAYCDRCACTISNPLIDNGLI